MKIEYDEISPITGNKKVLVEYDTVRGDVVKMCMDTGFQTLINTYNPNTNGEWFEQKKSMPSFIAKTEFVEPNAQHWYMIPLRVGDYVLWAKSDSNGKRWWIIGRINVLNGTSAETVDFVTPEGSVAKLETVEGGIFDMEQFSTALDTFTELATNKGSDV